MIADKCLNSVVMSKRQQFLFVLHDHPIDSNQMAGLQRSITEALVVREGRCVEVLHQPGGGYGTAQVVEADVEKMQLPELGYLRRDPSVDLVIVQVKIPQPQREPDGRQVKLQLVV